MRLRDATPADLDVILHMVDRINKLHQEWDPARFTLRDNILPGYRRWLAARITDPRSLLVVGDAGTDDTPRVAGYVVGSSEDEIPIYWMPETGWIHDVWVEPDYRHEGLGRQLVMHAVERFREMGHVQVRLQTAQSNDLARTMFAACGFRPATVEMICELTPPPGEEGRGE